MRRTHARLACLLVALLITLALPTNLGATVPPELASRLAAFGPDGKLGDCALAHTDVRIDVSGPTARVIVRQKYVNPFPDKIEAVYTFPLSHRGAVDRMRMEIGDRVVDGVVRERQAARRNYEDAKQQGKVAALLDQQRPNIFQQAVANIAPGAEVNIAISYTETLPCRAGEYRLEFPLVVGPRYIPNSAE